MAATITVANPDVAAHAATLGFDFLWVEMEHSPITLETLRNIVLATRGLPGADLRARAGERNLDRQARAGCRRQRRDVPLHQHARTGRAGRRRLPLSARRTARIRAPFWRAPPGPRARPDYHDSADANVMVIIIIEEARAVERIDEIAATPGVDVLFIGTNDLSFSLGLRGNQNDPKLEAAIARIAEAGKRHGKFLGRPAATPEIAQQYMEQGFLLFQGPTDLGLMAAGARSYLEPYGRMAGAPAPRALY